jgi:hypothetical protein
MVGLTLLMPPEALHNVTETACSFLMVMMLRPLRPRVRAMVLRTMLSRIALVQSSMYNVMRCDERYDVWNVIEDLVYLN